MKSWARTDYEILGRAMGGALDVLGLGSIRIYSDRSSRLEHHRATLQVPRTDPRVRSMEQHFKDKLQQAPLEELSENEKIARSDLGPCLEH